MPLLLLPALPPFLLLLPRKPRENSCWTLKAKVSGEIPANCMVQNRSEDQRHRSNWHALIAELKLIGSGRTPPAPQKLHAMHVHAYVAYVCSGSGQHATSAELVEAQAVQKYTMRQQQQQQQKPPPPPPSQECHHNHNQNDDDGCKGNSKSYTNQSRL